MCYIDLFAGVAGLSKGFCRKILYLWHMWRWKPAAEMEKRQINLSIGIPYLKDISRKPRSLRNSGIYEMMPENMRRFMDTCDSADRGKVLKALSELTDRTGFDSALRTVEEATNLQISDSESLKSLYRRLYADVPALQPLESSTDIPLGKIIPLHNDFSAYDAALKGGARHG